jgi:NhaP-type Na+/H+ or K+/H+ antiporter
VTDPLAGLTVVVVLAVGSMLLAARLRIPAIVPLLVAGVLACPSVADVVNPNELLGDLLSPFVSLAVGVILFEGALGLRLEELEDDTPPVVVRLLTLGALITWAVGFGGAVVLLDLPVGISLLVGAILIVSGPTVLPLPEFVRPKPAVGRVLRWEGILIDPIGALVAALVCSPACPARAGSSPVASCSA